MSLLKHNASIFRIHLPISITVAYKVNRLEAPGTRLVLAKAQSLGAKTPLYATSMRRKDVLRGDPAIHTASLRHAQRARRCRCQKAIRYASAIPAILLSATIRTQVQTSSQSHRGHCLEAQGFLTKVSRRRR